MGGEAENELQPTITRPPLAKHSETAVLSSSVCSMRSMTQQVGCHRGQSTKLLRVQTLLQPRFFLLRRFMRYLVCKKPNYVSCMFVWMPRVEPLDLLMPLSHRGHMRRHVWGLANAHR
jgi:hypothetical protein